MSCICMALYLRTLLPTLLARTLSFRPFNPASNYTCSTTIGALAQVIIILLSYQRYCHSWTHTTITLFEVLGLVQIDRSLRGPRVCPLAVHSREDERPRRRLDNGSVFANWQLVENLMELCSICLTCIIFSQLMLHETPYDLFNTFIYRFIFIP